jgi:hypothetical protein
MIVWGSGGDAIKLGVLETRRCDTCEKERPFDLTLQYRYWALYWIFGMVTKKQYLLACDVCGRGRELEPSKIDPRFAAVPIPFMRRYGLLVLGAVVAGVIVLGSLSGRW